MKGQRIVYFTAYLLAGICEQDSEHYFRCTKGLPADAMPIRAFPKPPIGQVGEECIVAVVFESAEWEPLPEGAMIEALMPLFESIPMKKFVAS